MQHAPLNRTHRTSISGQYPPSNFKLRHDPIPGFLARWAGAAEAKTSAGDGSARLRRPAALVTIALMILTTAQRAPSFVFALVAAGVALVTSSGCGPAPDAPPAEISASPGAQADALWPHQASDLAPDPAVRFGVLANGLRYAVLANPQPTEAVALRLYFDHGSLDEADDQLGLAHVLEHMAFNGSANVPEGEMVKILERAGLQFGPDTNAFTSFDQTVYQLDVPDISDETLDTAFFLLREIADKLTIAPDALDRERGVVLSEARAADTYRFRFTRSLWRFLYQGTHFAERFPIGSTEVIAAAPAERVRALYEAHHRPDEALLVMVGALDAADMAARIEATFDDWAAPDVPVPARTETTGPVRGGEAGLFIDPDMPPTLTLAVLRPAEPYEDTAESRRERTLTALATGAFNRRLSRLARASDAPFVGGGASISRVFDAYDQATVSMTVKADVWREALTLAEAELRRAVEFGFSDAEIAEQIANAEAGLEARANSADTRQSPDLADNLVSAFNGRSVFTHPRSDRDRFAALAPELDAAAVSAAFADWWRGAEPLIFMSADVAPAGGADALLDAFAEARQAPVTAPEAAAALAFAYDDLGPPAEVVERRTIADLGVEQAVLSNGVRISVKPTAFEDEIARLSVRVGGGSLELPADQPGLDRLMDSALIRGGLGAHTLDDLVSILAGTTLDLSFSVRADAFAFSGATTPEDLPLQLQVYAAYLADPAWRVEALDQHRRGLEVWLPTLDATPGAVSARVVPRLIRNDDPRFGIPDDDALLSRDLDEARVAFERARTRGAIEVAVVGDVDVDAVIDAIARSFGALEMRESTPPAFEAARVLTFAPPTPAPVRLTHAGEDNRTLIQVYWPTFDDTDAARARAGRLLERVFDLKLTETVREAFGASYSPGAGAFHSRIYPGFGYLNARIEATPQEADRMLETIDAIAAELAGGSISDDELIRAKTPILETIAQNQERNPYWLSVISTAWSDPDSLDRHRSAEAAYRALSIDDLTAVASAHLRPEHAVAVVIGPPEGGAPEGGALESVD